METQEYKLSINSEIKQISITGFSPSAIPISYSSDIDFTKLVSGLASFMDKKKLLVPNAENDKSEDSSMKLILETISSIIEKYNDAVKGLDNNTDTSDLDSETEADSVDLNDDLPF